MSAFIVFLKKVDEGLTRIEEALVSGLLFVMMMVIFLAVLERFLFKMGITWIEEFARYVSVWAAFIGSSLAVKKGAHIGIEAFVQILPKKIRQVEELLVDLAGLAFSVVVVYIGIELIQKLLRTNQLSPAMRIPIAWAYIAVPVGCGLMGVHYLIKFITGVSATLSARAPEGEA